MPSVPKFFDIHTHVQFAAFNDDADLVIQRTLEAGVWMVNVGTQRDTSAKAVEFAEKYKEGVYATAGLHPIHTERSYHDPQELGAPEINIRTIHKSPHIDQHESGLRGFMSREEKFDYEYYKKLASHPKVVAIGECGLDYYRFKMDDLRVKNKQKEAFIKQIELAAEMKKPLMIHCRNAFQDLIPILKSYILYLKSSGIIHFFSGTRDDARELINIGFFFSFGGVITFSRDYDDVIKYIPLERILLETDAPYVTPIPYRGKRNEPSYVREAARKIAELKALAEEQVAAKTTENAMRIFNLSGEN